MKHSWSKAGGKVKKEKWTLEINPRHAGTIVSYKILNKDEQNEPLSLSSLNLNDLWQKLTAKIFVAGCKLIVTHLCESCSFSSPIHVPGRNKRNLKKVK